MVGLCQNIMLAINVTVEKMDKSNEKNSLNFFYQASVYQKISQKRLMRRAEAEPQTYQFLMFYSDLHSGGKVSLLEMIFYISI
jgi:hypothetical protein